MPVRPNTQMELQARLASVISKHGYYDSDCLMPRLARHIQRLHGPIDSGMVAGWLRKTRTQFFRANSVTAEEVAHVLWPEIAASSTTLLQPERQPSPEALFVSIDEIDSFRKVLAVSSKQVRIHVPLDILEDDIQSAIEAIVQELEHDKDWGGETSDLFTTRVVMAGKRIVAAWLLKGRALKGKLTPAKAGKRGTQIQRLFTEPADLFVVQHVDAIDSSVSDEMQLRAAAVARQRGSTVYWCTVDGTDTARLLKAYGFLS